MQRDHTACRYGSMTGTSDVPPIAPAFVKIALRTKHLSSETSCRRGTVIGQQPMKRVHLAATAIVVCLALTCYTAAEDVVPAVANYGRRPPAQTAWAFIQSQPELSDIAELLTATGFEGALQQPFRGTLLLPNNNALLAYINLLEYTPTFTMHRFAILFWETLVKYHMLSRSTSTRQKRSTALDTTHIKEPEAAGRSTRTAALSRNPVSGSFHQVTFLSRRTRLASQANNVSASTFRSSEAYAVQDEQGNSVTFASRNNAVLGGGLVHIINAVLQPDDVYPTLAALLDSRPELSIISTIIKELNLTTLWPDTCLWINKAVYNNNSYACVPQSTNHTCQPCNTTGYGCGYSYDYSYIYDPYYGCYSSCDDVWCPPVPAALKASGIGKGGNRRRLAAARALLQGEPGTSTAAAGTRAFEEYAGTFALPENNAFRRLPRIVLPLNRNRWEPVVQNHFIAAAHPPVPLTSTELLRYETRRKGGFGTNNVRRTFLGAMRNDYDHVVTYTSTRTGCGLSGDEACLSITYPVRGADGRLTTDSNRIVTNNMVDRSGVTNKPGANLQTPGHFYHVVEKVMEPLCDGADTCNQAFAGPARRGVRAGAGK